jgi:peptidoglycan/LPS O-acetylase OafA/YrhL
MTAVLENQSRPLAVYPQIRSTRYPSLDIWRGAACLMIVILHSTFAAYVGDVAFERLHHPLAARLLSLIDQMWIGIPLFFVISGYCISATADSSRRKAHPSSHYFKRRIRRIFPPYWIALAVTVALYGIATRFPALAGDPSQHFQYIPKANTLSSMQWFGNITLTETWRIHLGGGPLNAYLTPAWTLCYEEQFYAVCGLLILFMPRRFFSGALGVSILTAIVFALTVVFPGLHIKGFFFDGKWLMFAAGVLVYYVLNYLPPRARLSCALFLGIALVSAKILSKQLLFHGYNTDTVLDDPYAWYAAFIFALVILLLRPADGWICNSRLLWPIAICGRMCYSLYLIHWPLCKIIGNLLLLAGVRGFVPELTITAPIIIAVSILAGWAFHLVVERHFLNPPATLVQPIRRPEPIAEPQLSAVAV